MGIIEKIEEIRNKPEHIRLRYVWFFVALSMGVVLFVWFSSMKMQMMQFDGSNNGMTEKLGATANEFSKQSQSLKTTVENTKKSLTDEAVAQ